MHLQRIKMNASSLWTSCFLRIVAIYFAGPDASTQKEAAALLTLLPCRRRASEPRFGARRLDHYLHPPAPNKDQIRLYSGHMGGVVLGSTVRGRPPSKQSPSRPSKSMWTSSSTRKNGVQLHDNQHSDLHGTGRGA